jgi:hypothetical protein
MYGPSLCARFQNRTGADVELSLFTSGCPFDDVTATPYKMWHIPVLLRTVAQPKYTTVTAADKQLHYQGAWYPLTTREDVTDTELNALPRATQTEGSSVELSFTGTGIEYIAQKSSGQGSVEIYLDSVRQQSASLNLEDFPVFFGVVVFSKQKLPQAKHMIKIVNAGKSRINLEAFRIYA